jgi:serine/threonine-protein kinase
MSQLEKIDFLERIGSGGMAEIYRARLVGCAGFAKTVVVKRLKNKYRGIAPMVKMFADEARLTAEVQHKNIVQVYELVERDGELLIIMEFVPGQDLRKALKRAGKRGVRVPVWLSLHLVTEILEGLVYAHALCDDHGRPRGIIHRDVAPDNVFLSRHGDVKLGDFGIAHETTDTTPELDDHVKGKLPYMAPELFDGKGFDQRVDVFSASVLLWECLTQRRLFKKKTDVETMRAICLDPRLPPSRYANDVPHDLDRLVLAGLEVDRRRRIPTAYDMQRALLQILHRLHPNMRQGDVRSAIRALIDEPAAPADDLVIDVVEDPTEDEPILELSPWDVISDSGVWATPTPSVDLNVGDGTPAPMVMDSWTSGNYAIVRGRGVGSMEETIPTARPPIPAPKGRIETGEILPIREEPIPMPGGPSRVETGDILRKHAPTAALPARYWIRSLAGEQGPMGVDAAMAEIRAHLELQGPSAAISADGRRWLPIPRFLELTGQEIREPDQFLPRGGVSGSLSSRSLVALLGEMARQRATGRLVVTKGALPPSPRREIHFHQGLPTMVAATEPELQPHRLILDHRLVTDAMMDDCMAQVLIEQRPLDFILGQRARINPDELRSFVMTLRLESIFDWTSGHFAFDAKAEPASTRPFASSIHALLPLILERRRSNDALRRAVAPYLDRAFAKSQHFAETVSCLGLSPAEAEWIATMGQFATLGEWFASGPIDERRAMIVTHLLLELGLLRQPTPAPTTADRR